MAEKCSGTGKNLIYCPTFTSNQIRLLARFGTEACPTHREWDLRMASKYILILILLPQKQTDKKRTSKVGTEGNGSPSKTKR